jgi:hypothetical protein
MDENKNVQEQETETTTQENKIELTEKELQSMIDKRVSQALATQKQKLEEANKLANMSAEERREAEYQEKIKALEEREAKLARAEMLTELTKQLSEKNLPVESADFLLGKDADATSANLKAFEKMFNKAVSAQVAQQLGGNAPQASTNETGAITKEQFSKMTLAQQSQLYRDNPELYNSLVK